MTHNEKSSGQWAGRAVTRSELSLWRIQRRTESLPARRPAP